MLLRSTALIERKGDESFRFATPERVDPDASHHDFRIPALLFEPSEGTTRTRPDSRWSWGSVGRNKHSAGLWSVESLLSDGPETVRPDSGLPSRTVRKDRQQPILILACRVALLESRATNHLYAVPAPTSRLCGWVRQETVRNLVCSFNLHRRITKDSSRFPTGLPPRPDGTTRTRHLFICRLGLFSPEE